MVEVPDTDQLLEGYSLTVANCSREVSDCHLDEISRLHSREWKSLPPYLGIPNIVAEDSSLSAGDPREKRLNFFLKWKQKKGSGATYLRLISALLKIQCKKDAESVCELLQATLKQKMTGEGKN